MRRNLVRAGRTLSIGVFVGGVLAGCSSGEVSVSSAASDRPTVVVTTNILGDVVENLVGDELNVVTIMPVGSDPHDFQASARQVAQIRDAEVLIINGAGFEEGLVDVIEAAEADGVPTFAAISAIEALEFGHEDEDHGDEDHGDEDHGDEDHGDEDHGDEEHDEHAHSGVDPHFFTDPARMAITAKGIETFLVANVDGVNTEALAASAQTYIAELQALDGEVATALAVIPEEQRVLVTNHEVFGYFAERYGLEVVGTVVPSGTTTGGADAQRLVELALIIEQEGVPAIFADTSSSDELASTLANEVGDVEVVELFSESLGADGSNGDTYLSMIRTNATRIADALTR